MRPSATRSLKRLGLKRLGLKRLGLNRLGLKRLGAVALGLAIWEAAFRAHLINPVVFASPSLVLKAAINDAGEFSDAFKITCFEIAVATTISWGFGVIGGALVGMSRFASRVTVPFLSALIAVPFVILYPILIAWLGIGPPSKIAFGVLLGIFPIALNTAIGVQSIDPGYVDMARAMGATRWQLILQVLTPLAIPTITVGLRLGVSLIVAGVILTEMLGATGGIGYLISYHQALFDTGDVMLGVLLGIALSLIANWMLSLLEGRFSGWRDSQQSAADA